MLENNPNNLDSTQGNGKTYIYNKEDDTWKNFGGTSNYPLVSYDNDGLVYPDLYDRIIQVQQRQQEGLLNNLKLTPNKPYFYMFYSSDGFVKFTPDNNKMIIELNKGAITRRLFKSPCVGPRGAQGPQGKSGRDGVPAPNEKFRPVYQDGSFDLEVATPLEDTTPISLRGYTIFEKVFEALIYADGTTEDPDKGLTEVKVTGDFKNGKVDVKGILANPDLKFKIRQVGPQGVDGDDGVNYVQVIQEDNNASGQYSEVVGMLRYNSTLNLMTFKKTTINELLNNTLSIIPNANLPSGSNWVAAQITSNPRKDVQYHNYQTGVSAPPLNLPSYTPLSGCYNQRRYAMGYLQAEEDIPFTIVTDSFPEYKSCKDPYWFCGNSGDKPCDGLIDVDPDRPNAPFEESTSSTSDSSDESSESTLSSESSSESESDSGSSSESESDSGSSSESESDSGSSSESTSESDSSLSTQSDSSLSTQSDSSNSDDNSSLSTESDSSLSTESDSSLSTESDSTLSAGDASSDSSNIPSSDSSDAGACVSTVTWTQSGSPGTCSLNNYKVIGGVPTITLYFNSCSSVYMTLTWTGATWTVSGYPTICAVTVNSHSESDLFCAGAGPVINIELSLGSPCDLDPSDTISVP